MSSTPDFGVWVPVEVVQSFGDLVFHVSGGTVAEIVECLKQREKNGEQLIF